VNIGKVISFKQLFYILMPQLRKCVYVDDLLAIILFSCLGVVFTLISPLNETFIRIPFAFAFFFFIPGYAFISALFPGKSEINYMQRFTLSIGFSLILMVFDGFFINSFWGYRSTQIVISTLGITAFFSITAIFARKLLNESDQYTFSIKEFIQSIKSDEIIKDDSNETQGENLTTGTKRHFHRSKSKVKAKSLKSQIYTEFTRISPPLGLEKGLAIGLIVSIILVSGMNVYIKVTKEENKFSALYILGSNGKTEGYPTESLINVPLNVIVGIENHEHQDANYTLQMKVDRDIIKQIDITVKDGATWQQNMTYTRHKSKVGRSNLEFILFKDKQSSEPYRSVNLYIENNNTLTSGNKQLDSELPAIENGDMESSTGWKFTSNIDKIKGSYVNGSGIHSSNTYRIVNSYEGNLSSTPEYGEITQNIEAKEDTAVVLSAYFRSFSDSSSQGADNQMERVIVNGETIWTEGISTNQDWQHIVLPIELQKGKNSLTLGLYQTAGEIKPVEVLWDGISLNSQEDINSIMYNGIVEANPPKSSVLGLPNFINSTSFTVSWNGTDSDSGIAYYSIDSSTDGINWDSWIPRTTDNSSVFTGENNKTYYFRSKAVDNVGNEEPEHQQADTQTKVYIGATEVKLDISPNPCKNATAFTVTYPLTLKSAVCLVTPDGFGTESIELNSTDGTNWTGGYIIKHSKHFVVEAVCTDINGNTSSSIDDLTVDNSAPDFVIETNPQTIDYGDLEIKVTPSTALSSIPSVSVSANETVNVTYLSYLNGAYYYKAKIDPDINEGKHEVSVTGSGLDSQLYGGKSIFVISHSSKVTI
jgi:uncharacterized membrane protein